MMSTPTINSQFRFPENMKALTAKKPSTSLNNHRKAFNDITVNSETPLKATKEKENSTTEKMIEQKQDDNEFLFDLICSKQEVADDYGDILPLSLRNKIIGVFTKDELPPTPPPPSPLSRFDFSLEYIESVPTDDELVPDILSPIPDDSMLFLYEDNDSVSEEIDWSYSEED